MKWAQGGERGAAADIHHVQFGVAGEDWNRLDVRQRVGIAEKEVAGCCVNEC